MCQQSLHLPREKGAWLSAVFFLVMFVLWLAPCEGSCDILEVGAVCGPPSIAAVVAPYDCTSAETDYLGTWVQVANPPSSLFKLYKHIGPGTPKGGARYLYKFDCGPACPYTTDGVSVEGKWFFDEDSQPLNSFKGWCPEEGHDTAEETSECNWILNDLWTGIGVVNLTISCQPPDVGSDAFVQMFPHDECRLDPASMGVTSAKCLPTDGIELNSRNEGRVEFPLGEGVALQRGSCPRSGTFEVHVNVESGYQYSSGVFSTLSNRAVIWSTWGEDVAYPGVAEVVVWSDGRACFDMSVHKYWEQYSSLCTTGFSMNMDHVISWSFGSEGACIALDGNAPVCLQDRKQRLEVGGEHDQSRFRGKVTLGEYRTVLYRSNNWFDQGANMIVHAVRVSQKQRDFQLYEMTTRSTSSTGTSSITTTATTAPIAFSTASWTVTGTGTTSASSSITGSGTTMTTDTTTSTTTATTVTTTCSTASRTVTDTVTATSTSTSSQEQGFQLSYMTKRISSSMTTDTAVSTTTAIAATTNFFAGSQTVTDPGTSTSASTITSTSTSTATTTTTMTNQTATGADASTGTMINTSTSTRKNAWESARNSAINSARNSTRKGTSTITTTTSNGTGTSTSTPNVSTIVRLTITTSTTVNQTASSTTDPGSVTNTSVTTVPTSSIPANQASFDIPKSIDNSISIASVQVPLQLPVSILAIAFLLIGSSLAASTVLAFSCPSMDGEHALLESGGLFSAQHNAGHWSVTSGEDVTSACGLMFVSRLSFGKLVPVPQPGSSIRVAEAGCGLRLIPSVLRTALHNRRDWYRRRGAAWVRAPNDYVVPLSPTRLLLWRDKRLCRLQRQRPLGDKLIDLLPEFAVLVASLLMVSPAVALGASCFCFLPHLAVAFAGRRQWQRGWQQRQQQRQRNCRRTISAQHLWLARDIITFTVVAATRHLELWMVPVCLTAWFSSCLRSAGSRGALQQCLQRRASIWRKVLIALAGLAGLGSGCLAPLLFMAGDVGQVVALLLLIRWAEDLAANYRRVFEGSPEKTPSAPSPQGAVQAWEAAVTAGGVQDANCARRHAMRSAIRASGYLCTQAIGDTIPEKAWDLFERELAEGEVRPEGTGSFLSFLLGLKCGRDRRWLAEDLSRPETMAESLQLVEMLRWWLGHGNSNAVSNVVPFRNIRPPEEAIKDFALPEDHVALSAATFQEKFSGRSLDDAELDLEGFRSTCQLLKDQLDSDEPFKSVEDGGPTQEEFEVARRGIGALILEQPPAMGTKANLHKLQVIVYCEGRHMFGDELKQVKQHLQTILRAALGLRKSDGSLAKRKPEFWLVPWRAEDQLVFPPTPWSSEDAPSERAGLAAEENPDRAMPSADRAMPSGGETAIMLLPGEVEVVDIW